MNTVQNLHYADNGASFYVNNLDKNGNSDGKATPEEFLKYQQDLYSSIFSTNDVLKQKAMELAQKQYQEVKKYAGDDGIFSVEDYENYLSDPNSKSTELIKEYWQLEDNNIDLNKTPEDIYNTSIEKIKEKFASNPPLLLQAQMVLKDQYNLIKQASGNDNILNSSEFSNCLNSSEYQESIEQLSILKDMNNGKAITEEQNHIYLEMSSKQQEKINGFMQKMKAFFAFFQNRQITAQAA